MQSINKDNYIEMQKRIADMPNNDKVDGSSNFYKLITYLESPDYQWINLLNDKLE